MKILIETTNSLYQNVEGGVQNKIRNIYKHLGQKLQLKYFDKWNDTLSDYDILHVFLANYEDYQLINLAKKTGIKIVVSAIVSIKSPIKILVSNILGKYLKINTPMYKKILVLKMADAVIAETSKEKRFIYQYYRISKNKIHIIPNGVEKDKIFLDKDLFQKKTGITGKFVLQVGRFDPNKNQLSTIKALFDSDITVVFIGGYKKNEEKYYNICRRNANNNMHFLNWIDSNDPLLYSAYANAHVLVLPSKKEIFGNVLFEAGLFGVNLVLTKVLPLEDWGFTNYCEIINPYNYKDIEEKVKIALNKSKSKDLVNIIDKKFNWDRIVEEHIKIYESL